MTNPPGGDGKEPQSAYQATREGEYMFPQPIPLSVIGDRAHGELSINGVMIDEKGPATREALNQLVDIASESGITMTCKDVMRPASTLSTRCAGNSQSKPASAS